MDTRGYRNRYLSQSLEVEKSALLKNKYERQKVTGDNHKLKNRISMLENEQNKMLKKINETRRKADKIMKIKQNNEVSYIEKMRRQKMEEEMLGVFRRNNKMQKEDMKVRTRYNQMAIFDSKRAENLNSRYVSKLSDRIKLTFNDEEVRKNQQIVNHVRKSENITRK